MKRSRAFVLSFFCFLTLPIVQAAYNSSIADATTIMNFLGNPGSFRQMYSLLQETRVDILFNKPTLVSGGPYTIFAPTDDAFAKFGRVGLLSGKAHAELLKTFVKFHILQGRRRKKSFRNGVRMRTFAGEVLEINEKEIGNILYSIDIANSVIHVTDKVLVCPSLKSMLKVQ